ncbi:MAG: SDR family NAD(P)-dependent oxidoreductase, partial [Oceanicaulis sp.]
MTRGAALVTGGAKRVGRAFIEALAGDGHAVAIHFNTSGAEAEALAETITAAGGRAVAVGADLTDPAATQGLIGRSADALGPIALLVNS